MIDHSAPTLLMPGGSRLRSLKPLRTRRGICPLIYDVERNLLIRVPVEYQFHLGYALEKGEPDEELIGWLAGNDLLTLDWGATEPPWDADHPALSPDGPVAGLGRVFLHQGRYHAQVGLDDEIAAHQTVAWLNGRMEAGSRITLHVNAGHRLDLRALEILVQDLERSATALNAQADFELTVDAERVTEDAARFLADHPFHVRTRCDGPLICEGVDLAWDPAHACEGARAEGLTRLVRALGDRLVVHSVLAGGVRLAYLWDWARESGVRRLHVTKVGRAYQPSSGDPLARATELREFQLDLEAVAEEMFRTLEAGYSALLYEPIVRVVRRMAGQKGEGLGTPTSLGVAADGHASPFLQAMWRRTVGVAEDLTGGEAEAGPGACPSPCNSCWGRRLCGRGKQPDPCLTAGERLPADERRCEFWRAEIEAGLHFHQRLRGIDPDYYLGLVRTSVGAFDGLDAFRQPVVWKTC